MSLTAAAVALMLSSAVPDATATTLTIAAPTPATEPVITTAADNTAAPAAGEEAPVPAPDAVPASPSPASPSPATPSPATPSPATPSPATPSPETLDTRGNDIVVSRRKPTPGDPLARVNETSFKATQAIDKAVLGPVAKIYNKGPRPLRQGLRNFVTNLNEPVIFAAYLLEFKPGKAVETAGRFVVNSTLGVAGFIDVAKRKPFNLPYRPNGLADVLGYYGVGPGPYFYLPIIGPTTLRDVIGDTVDNLALPAVVGEPLTKPAVAIPLTIGSQFVERAAFDDQVNRIRESDNPYANYRDLYLRQRKAEIEALHGRVTPDVVPVYGPGMKLDRDIKKPEIPTETGPTETGPTETGQP